MAAGILTDDHNITYPYLLSQLTESDSVREYSSTYLLVSNLSIAALGLLVKAWNKQNLSCAIPVEELVVE